MLYCQNCGDLVSKDAKYCPVCGTKLERTITEDTTATNEFIKKVELIHEGNVTRIIVKDEVGKTLLEIPATVGGHRCDTGTLAGNTRGHRSSGDSLQDSCGEKGRIEP